MVLGGSLDDVLRKYRGLKSFRTSTWDPYEDLPVEYSRIWEFEAFASTARSTGPQCTSRDPGSEFLHLFL
eukprot:s5471_g2.t1